MIIIVVFGTPASLSVVLFAAKLVIVVLPALSLICAGDVFSPVTWLESVDSPGVLFTQVHEGFRILAGVGGFVIKSGRILSSFIPLHPLPTGEGRSYFGTRAFSIRILDML